MSRKNQIAVACTLIVVVAAAGAAALMYSRLPVAFTPMTAANLPAQFLNQPIPDNTANATQLQLGQYLVRAGDCASCHTREGGPLLGGGFGLNTPFGVIYTQNITGDRETGIGAWTPDEFYVAIHDGIGRRGEHLYPGLPYVYFTHVTRTDSDAALAFLKTVPAVTYTQPPNELPFPLNNRILLAGWNLLFFSSGSFEPDTAKSAEWNRGAYLVTGLGHCGACHTPKNILAGDRMSNRLEGGNLDNWVAPDLTGNTRTGLGSWTVADIVDYLKTGRNAHSNAGGSMAEVVTFSTSLLTDQDLNAIAVYLKDRPASSDAAADTKPDAGSMTRGAAIYSDACSSCHLEQGVGQPGLFPPLRGNAMSQQADPTGLLHVILAGSRTGPTRTRPSPLSMTSFAWKLTDKQIADVATYIRNSWSNRASGVTAKQVAGMRDRLGLMTEHFTDNSGDH